MNRPPSAADRVDAPPLEPGSVFADRYDVVRRLGTGGMGTVYLARHREMGRLCALKLLHPALSRDAEARDRFHREARNACRIVHPNACTVFDFGATAQGQLYLVMEYLDGRSLGAILAEAGALPLPRVGALVGQIAAGLDAAHELGLVHRDLKPDNVIITPARGRETVKLVDFGIAKAVEPDLHGAVTAAGTVVGTPEYMAPEQFAGDPVDQRADVYALGLVSYRMLTGTLPFRAATARESLARRLTEPPAPLAAAAPGRHFPDAVQSAVSRALTRDPAQRFPTAGAFASALQAAAAGVPAEGQAETVRLGAATLTVERARPGPWPFTRPGLIGLATVGAAALAALVIFNNSRDARPSAPANDPGSAPPPAAPTPASDTGSGGPGRAESLNRVLQEAVPRRVPPIEREEFLPDSATLDNPAARDAFRTREAQIYARPDTGFVRRAQAAFAVATVYLHEARYDSAAAWVERALVVNDSAPDTVERRDRQDRYQRLRTQVRLQAKEPPSS
jgi:serine/threonine-protein kinase